MSGHPIRSCVACRRRAPKHELVRLVASARGPGASAGRTSGAAGADPALRPAVRPGLRPEVRPGLRPEVRPGLRPEVQVDPRADQPGRGAYVCPEGGCLEQALRGGGARIARALRRPGVRVDEDELRRWWPTARSARAADAADSRQGVVA